VEVFNHILRFFLDKKFARKEFLIQIDELEQIFDEALWELAARGKSCHFVKEILNNVNNNRWPERPESWKLQYTAT